LVRLPDEAQRRILEEKRFLLLGDFLLERDCHWVSFSAVQASLQGWN
jgi:hypothetical protein